MRYREPVFQVEVATGNWIDFTLVRLLWLRRRVYWLCFLWRGRVLCSALGPFEFGCVEWFALFVSALPLVAEATFLTRRSPPRRTFRVQDPGKQQHRRWIFLSTCMATRVIQLEAVENLSAMRVINALRRLIARRGKPQLIISFNATKFKLGQEILTPLYNRVETDDNSVQHFLANKAAQW